MFSPSISGQLTVQNGMNSSPECTISIDKSIKNTASSLHLSRGLRLLESPITKWAPHLLLTILSTAFAIYWLIEMIHFHRLLGLQERLQFVDNVRFWRGIIITIIAEAAAAASTAELYVSGGCCC